MSAWKLTRYLCRSYTPHGLVPGRLRSFLRSCIPAEAAVARDPRACRVSGLRGLEPGRWLSFLRSCIPAEAALARDPRARSGPATYLLLEISTRAVCVPGHATLHCIVDIDDTVTVNGRKISALHNRTSTTHDPRRRRCGHRGEGARPVPAPAAPPRGDPARGARRGRRAGSGGGRSPAPREGPRTWGGPWVKVAHFGPYFVKVMLGP